MKDVSRDDLKRYLRILNKIIRSKSGPQAACVETETKNNQELQDLKKIRSIILDLKDSLDLDPEVL